MERTVHSRTDIKDYILDEQVCEGVIQLRRQYWKLDHARNLSRSRNENEKTESEDANGRPLTCLLYPGLTPSKLYDHLKNHGASDACILEWTRRLQILRREPDKKTKAYGIKMLGK